MADWKEKLHEVMLEPQISFGYSAFWPKAHAAFPRFWEVYPRVGEAHNSVFYAHYTGVGQLERVIINLGILAGTSLCEIATLVGNGLGHGAAKITRSMLEVAINAEFLRKFPEHLDDYLDWHFVEHYQLLKYVRDNAPQMLPEYPQAQQDQIDADFQSVRGRFEICTPGAKPRLRQGWCSMGLADRAAKTDFLEAYKLIYPLGNKLLHGTIGGMSMHANPSDESVRIAPPPSLQNCKVALVGSHTCAIRAAKTVSDLMGRELLPSFDVLTKDYGYAWPVVEQRDQS